MRELVFTPAARADLEEIFWFIADSPRRARSYIAEVEQACRSLCDMPEMGVRRPDLRPGLRIFPLWRRIVIAYELPDGRVDVLRYSRPAKTTKQSCLATEQPAQSHFSQAMPEARIPRDAPAL